jgi:hypothetical protein
MPDTAVHRLAICQSALTCIAVLLTAHVNHKRCRVTEQVDTEGRIASDSFFVTYHGEPLNQSMVQLVTNALQVRPLLLLPAH